MALPPKRCPPGTVPVSNPPRCVPPGRGPIPGNFGGTPSGGFFPFSNAAASAAAAVIPSVTPSPTPPPPPPQIDCHDVMTTVPFSVPVTSTVNVSGGGAALQAAVVAAAPGTRLLITDSLTYSPVAVVGCTNLTIQAAPGQTPQIRRPAPSHIVFGWCLSLQGVISGFAIRGVTFHGNGNRNGLSFQDDGLLNLRPNSAEACTAADRIIVEDCIFAEDGTDNVNSGPGILFIGTNGVAYQNISIHRCIFSNNANGAAVTGLGYGACTVGGFATVYIQNSEVIRTDAIVTRAASNMRGFVFHNLSTIIEDCLTFDIGTGGSNENYKQILVSGGVDVAIGPTSVRNSVAYNCKRGWRMDTAGATMTLQNCVGDVAAVGILAGNVMMRQTTGTLVVRNSVMVGAGDGTAFEAAVTENHNDVFNFGALGKVLDPTDITIDPMFEDVPAGDWKALAPAAQTAASDGGLIGIRYQAGEKIIWCNH